MINSMEDVQKLVLQGENDWSKYGMVNVKEQRGLLIFNYSQERQFSSDDWNYLETVSRGLIIDPETAEIIARPFPKFFNYSQQGKYFPARNTHMAIITEKLDGSMGCLYFRYGYKIATRGSLESDQAIWATNFLNENYDLTGLPEEYTLLFEIIYPENRIVVDYGDREDLVLLAVINRHTGEELPFYPLGPFFPDTSVYQIAEQYGFSLPEVYSFNNPTEILEWCGKIEGVENEGCVVLYSDGQRFKFKGDSYLELHRLISNITFKNVFETWSTGKLSEFMTNIPDEFLQMIEVWQEQIEDEYERLDSEIKIIFEELPKETRKEFALAISEKKYLPLLFALYDNQQEKYNDLLNKLVYQNLS